jgi:hypothetical protein
VPHFFSRGFEDDPNYYPQWRSLQAREYAKEYEEAVSASPAASYCVPPEETDELVLDYFNLLTLNDCNENGVKYAHNCNETNPTRGFGTLIQSMLVGGCTLSTIADELATTEENVQTYINLFFDVERYLNHDNLMSSIISPYSKVDDSSKVKQQTLWLSLSYAFGWNTAKTVLQRRMDVDSSAVDKFVESMKNCINMQAAEYAMAVRSGSVARPSDFERYISQVNATALSAAGHTEEMSSNAQNFRAALLGLIKDTSKALPDSHPVRQMIELKEAKVIEIEQKTSTAQKRFGNYPLKRL